MFIYVCVCVCVCVYVCVCCIFQRRKWQPTPVFLPRKFHAQRSMAGYSPHDHKSQTRLSN